MLLLLSVPITLVYMYNNCYINSSLISLSFLSPTGMRSSISSTGMRSFIEVEYDYGVEVIHIPIVTNSALHNKVLKYLNSNNGGEFQQLHHN
jgi:hypothetical protein